MKKLFDQLSYNCSEKTTKTYSTSFSFGIRVLYKSLREPIYNIYGFVRFADEIVDSFHDFNKKELLIRFKKDTFKAIEEKISLNPILNSFQSTVHKYNIDLKLIDNFLDSMQMDLNQQSHNDETYKNYIYGSAEVVGLMCLHVFVNADDKLYHKLKPFAMKLGSAFQKVNFLRDINNDTKNLGRIYFPNIDINDFQENQKIDIEKDIYKDFSDAFKGIQLLPLESRGGVYLAYLYYITLFKKIESKSINKLFEDRIRLNNIYKINLMFRAIISNYLNLV